MIIINNHLGSINITKRFFTALIGGTVAGCYGVAGMNSGTLWQNMAESLPFLRRRKEPDKGVSVKLIENQLYIDLHITVTYGINAASVTKSIQHKVTYAVEEETGIKVGRVNVYIDAIKS
ncbi:MAG: Asp23/Gls24 family envelope stress response protein [Oscillospiraceae bacterium]|nr:Asp23/Gls24 family envelope stress response protein [Oscillospiraceae bacterium]